MYNLVFHDKHIKCNFGVFANIKGKHKPQQESIPVACVLSASNCRHRMSGQYQLPSIYKHKELNLYFDLPKVTESARSRILKNLNISVTDSNVTLH